MANSSFVIQWHTFGNEGSLGVLGFQIGAMHMRSCSVEFVILVLIL